MPNQGKWLSGGKRGEYYLLGRGYSGQTVANVYFPVDGTPEVTPDKWNYVYTAGAYNSWMDKSKYKYEEQLNYMKIVSYYLIQLIILLILVIHIIL